VSPDKFIAETNRAISDSALMLAGTDPRRQERWMLNRSEKLRKEWRRLFTTLA
jgi:hypothetical protein